MKSIDSYWWDRNGVAIALLPISWLFCGLVFLRRLLYRIGIFRRVKMSVPVIVIGNISVGGTGKTPLVIWLVSYLQRMGFKPGVVSRGYGGNAEYWPQQVMRGSDPRSVGDEPVLIANRTDCPVSVGPDRVIAALALQEYTDCDVIVSDDGMQHYALGRDIEIVVVDGDRGLGNGFCLPAGPLRERVSRLNSVDLVVSNGAEGRGRFVMLLKQTGIVNIAKPEKVITIEQLAKQDKVHALAGIGNPERFFKQLEIAGVNAENHAYPDHHSFSPEDLEQFGDDMVVMTEKDAVKCKRFAGSNHWFVRVDADLHDTFEHRLKRLIKGVTDG